MKLNAPSKMFFLISLILAALVLISLLTPIGFVSVNSTAIALIAWAVLAAGCIFTGV